MSDLVKRLRAFDSTTHDAWAICEEAADALELSTLLIEELEGEIERLRQELG